MGLDARLYRTNHIKFPITINNIRELNNLLLYNEEIEYWRYGTVVHQFFEDKLGRIIENNEFILIPKEWLQELYTKCCDIENKCQVNADGLISNIEYCQKVLPTSDNFNRIFCRYDECYFSQVVSAKYKINKVLMETKFELYDIYYNADW